MDRPARAAHQVAGLQNGGEDNLSLCGSDAGACGLWATGAGTGRPRRATWQTADASAKVLRRLARAAEVTPFNPHVLRHTYASWGVTLGLSLPVVGQLLGHTAWTTTQRYAHLGPNPVEQGAELVGEALTKALGG